MECLRPARTKTAAQISPRISAMFSSVRLTQEYLASGHAGVGAYPVAAMVGQPRWAEMGVPDRGSMPWLARMYQAVVPVCSEAYT
jgi:hypothetical protein